MQEISDFLLACPILFKVLGSLGLILLLCRLTRNLTIAIALGAVALGFWSGQSYRDVIWISWERFSSPNNLMLMAIVFLVIALSSQMAKARIMKDLVVVVRSRFSKGTSMAILPALVGLLPMPGGALFSAPLVEECDGEQGVQPIRKVIANYWYRHIWEYWWPLYPGVLLTIAISGLEVWQFVLLMLPMTPVAIAIGYFFILRKLDPEKDNDAPRPEDPGISFFSLIS
ncbi:MAG: DUF401 family protein, partial [Planctomycetes bacterium]|nr:DUF401 family protein [Planctomycetota bacterium]